MMICTSVYALWRNGRDYVYGEYKVKQLFQSNKPVMRNEGKTFEMYKNMN